MKKIILVVTLSLFCGLAYAENKVYYDSKSGLEIVDVSGKKDIEQLKKDFNCSDLVDVTQERLAKQAEERVATEERAEIEKLIQEKIREQAIKELKAEGKLDAEGNIKNK